MKTKNSFNLNERLKKAKWLKPGVMIESRSGDDSVKVVALELWVPGDERVICKIIKSIFIKSQIREFGKDSKELRDTLKELDKNGYYMTVKLDQNFFYNWYEA